MTIDLNKPRSYVSPSFTTEVLAAAAIGVILAPAGLGNEWIIEHIDMTALEAGANTVTVYMGNNPVWVAEFFAAGDYRARDVTWPTGNNQPLRVGLSAAKSVRINVSHYSLPANA